MGNRRLVAYGGKYPKYTTMWVKYSTAEPEWQPRTGLQAIQSFDPDAVIKEQEEAYGPDDAR